MIGKNMTNHSFLSHVLALKMDNFVVKVKPKKIILQALWTETFKMFAYKLLFCDIAQFA